MGRVLLYSSGMDSWLIDKLLEPDVRLFVKLNTPSNDIEYQYLLKRNPKNLVVLDFNFGQFEQPEHNFFLPLRNLYLVSLAANYGDNIILGAVKGSVHFDNNPYFCVTTARLLTYLLSEKEPRKVNILTPFVNTTKAQLLTLYLDNGGDINLAMEETISCYQPNEGKECMACTSCMSKFTAFYRNGYKYKEEDIESFKNFVRENQNIVEEEVLNLYNELIVE